MWRSFCAGVPSAMIVGPPCSRPTKFTPTYGARARADLLVVDELLGQRRVATAVLLRPVDARIARVVQLALPRGVVRAARLPVCLLARRRAVRRHRVGQPCAQLAAERLVGVGVAEIHGSSWLEPGGAERSRSVGGKAGDTR